MPEKITLEQVLELVRFMKTPEGDWKVVYVYDDVDGDVYGNIRGIVRGSVGGVEGDVRGGVCGTINGRRWESVETPQEKLKRLIQESGDQELIKAFNQQLEDNNG